MSNKPPRSRSRSRSWCWDLPQNDDRIIESSTHHYSLITLTTNPATSNELPTLLYCREIHRKKEKISSKIRLINNTQYILTNFSNFTIKHQINGNWKKPWKPLHRCFPYYSLSFFYDHLFLVIFIIFSSLSFMFDFIM